MSLINDALKRAKQAQAENPTPPPDLPFRAVEPAQNLKPGFPLLPAAGLLVALLLGGGFIFVALQKRNVTPQVVHASQPGTTSASTPSPVEAPAPVATLARPTTTTSPTPPATATTVAVPTQPPITTPPTVSPSGSTDAPVAATNPEPPKLAVPKLQGIFYHPSRPSAVVGGKNVYVGSRVGESRGFLVLEITRESVTVANGSQTNVLVLVE